MSTERKSSRRAPSEDERALFRDALKDAKPLKRMRGKAKAPETAPRQSAHSPAEPPVKSPPRHEDVRVSDIGGHAGARLRHGRLEPGARLDLHGMTQDAAYNALVRFLMRESAAGSRLVLVITGKSGVLHAQLPFWLGGEVLRVIVVGANAAHLRHGGAGAFYVALRKQANVKRS